MLFGTISVTQHPPANSLSPLQKKILDTPVPISILDTPNLSPIATKKVLRSGISSIYLWNEILLCLNKLCFKKKIFLIGFTLHFGNNYTYTANLFSTTWLHCRVAVNVTLTSRCWKPFWTYQYGHRNNVTTPAPGADPGMGRIGTGPPFWQLNHANSAGFGAILATRPLFTGTRPPLFTNPESGLAAPYYTGLTLQRHCMGNTVAV